MKNLLYTLLLGLVVISCQKEDIGSGNAPLALSNDKEMTQAHIDNLINVVLDNLNSFGKSKRGQANLSGKGTDFIALHIFAQGGFTYMTLLDETNDDLCFGSIDVTTVFFDNSQGDGSILQVEDVDGNLGLALQGNWASTFSGGNNSLLKLDSDLNLIASSNISETNAVEFPAE